MDPTKEQSVGIQFCANLGKSATKTLAMIRQMFGEESISPTWEIFFDIKGILHNDFVLAGQTVSSAYYCDISW
jgi:hypothetical protein